MKDSAVKKIKENIDRLVRKKEESKRDYFSVSEEHRLIRKLKDDFNLLYNFATKDEKTGLHNNRYFTAELQKEIERAVRYKRTFSVLVLDLDNFKRVNDYYGHLKGDELLKRVAQVLLKNVRAEDTVSRFGGEEFTVLLPETDERGAFRVAEKLRKAILTDSLLGRYYVTTSIGISSLSGSNLGKEFREQKQATPYEIFKKADFALLWVKKNGKNQSKIWSDELR